MLWRAGSLDHYYLLASTVHGNVISAALASAHVIAAINFADVCLFTKDCCPSQAREMWESDFWLIPLFPFHALSWLHMEKEHIHH